MKKEILLEQLLGQCRIAVLEDGRLCELYYERAGHGKLAGNIYAGRVQNVLPGMNAAFVDIGLNKNAFLYAGDISIDTRDEQALREKLESARIEKMLRPGQMITVQVVKEPGGSKGPRISGSITLPGRMSVCLPTLKYAGVSKKITDAQERDRLYKIAQDISEKYGSGIIIRTAAEGMNDAQIAADYERLILLSRKILSDGQHAAAPRLLQADGSPALKTVRDFLDDQVTEVRTDDPQLFEQLRAYAQLLSPENAERIALLRGDTPLFDLKRVDHQAETALNRRVWLKSGGTLVIDETEALTVIDVNTGKFTGKKSLEDTIFALNCEAADEISRQIRLRDLGGILIIDFIDMDSDERKSELLEHLRAALKNDRNRTCVLGITELGLVEMTRKKVRQPLSKQLTRECTACAGSGREMTAETRAYRIAREIWRRRRAGDTTAYRVQMSAAVAEAFRRIGAAEDKRIEIADAGDGAEETLVPVGINQK